MAVAKTINKKRPSSRQSFDPKQPIRNESLHIHAFEALAYHYNNSPIGIIQWEDRRVTGWSKRAEQIFGWPSREAYGKTAEELELIFQDDPEVDRVRKKVLASGTSFFEKSIHRNKTRNGQIIYCEWHISILRDDAGEVLQVISFVQDITETVFSEISLAESRQQLDTIYNSVKEYLFLLKVGDNQNYRFISANKSFLEAVQLTNEEVTGKSLSDIWPPNDLLLMLAKCEQCATTREKIEWETLSTCKDEIRYGIMRLNPVVDEGGTCTQIVGALFDFTDRVKAENDYRKMYELVQASTNAITIIDNTPNRKHLFLNNAARKLYGLDEGENGTNSIDLMTKEELLRLRGIAMASNGHLTNVESYCVNQKTRQHIPILISSYPLRFDGKDMVAGIVSDLREIKLSESKLLEAYKELREYSLHLQTVREEERKYLAREVHDELGQLLTAIKMDVHGALGLLSTSDERPSRRLKDSLYLIDESISAVRKIVSDLHPYLLTDLGLSAALKALCISTKKKSLLQFRIKGLSGVPRFDTKTELAIYRIVQEALTNVQKHALAKKCWISVFKSKNKIRIEIGDDGVGFNHHVKRRKPSLGLLGMKERAETFGGMLEITSLLKQGTTITITVPL